MKNTAFGWMGEIFCPHTCKSCGKVGGILCECCKKNIKVGKLQYLPKCAVEFDSLTVCGLREGLLAELIKEYKYGPVWAIGGVLAEFLAVAIPCYKEEVIIVPLPTIGRHIRERGFDHMWLMGRRLAKIKGWRCERILGRRNATVQVGADKEQRKEQAEVAYELKRKRSLEVEKRYLLVDDVWTTGASMMAAAKVLKESGAKKISAAVVAIGRI